MRENDNSLFLLFVLLLLLGLTYMNELHAVDVGDLVKSYTFDGDYYYNNKGVK